MKFSTLLVIAFGSLLSTPSAVFAQNVVIGYPPSDTCITAGSSLTVEIDRPDTLSSSLEVAIVLGLQSCATSPCHSVSDGVGNVLYDGGYNPQFLNDSFEKPPHQNFTVAIPSNIPTGPAQLGVVHVALIGAGLAPFLETLNVTLNVIAA